MKNENDLNTILILMSNYRTLATKIAIALKRDSGMSADEVRDLAVAAHTILDNISALTDDKVKFHWLNPRPACHNMAVCGMGPAKIKTEHVEFVTCGKCKRSTLFKDATKAKKGVSDLDIAQKKAEIRRILRGENDDRPR